MTRGDDFRTLDIVEASDASVLITQRSSGLRFGCDNPPMERDHAEAFVEHWLQSWNSHDIDGVLSHFSEDAVFTSPHAAQLVPETGGVVRGKDALRRYWQTSLARVDDLHFELLATYVGVDTIVINYRNQRGTLANEVLTFTNGWISEGHGTYIENAAYHTVANHAG